MPVDEISGTEFLLDPKNPTSSPKLDESKSTIREISTLTDKEKMQNRESNSQKEVHYAKTISGLHELDTLPSPKTQTKTHASTQSKVADAGVSLELMEEIVRSQAREILENMAAKVVPDLASRMIQDELNRLLKDPPPPPQ